MVKIATPISRKQIREFANKIRKSVNLEDEYYFPIIQFIELVLPRIDPEFEYEIVEKEELPDGVYALTYPDQKKIVIRRDVYEGVCDDYGRARFTVAHELFHYLFHDTKNIGFARADEAGPAYVDPEWQANTFAGELLVPIHLIGGLSIDEIVEKCQVSKQCASIQMKYYKELKSFNIKKELSANLVQ